MGNAPANASEPAKGSCIGNAKLEAAKAGMEMMFGIEAKDKDEPIGVDFRGSVIKGGVQVQVTDQQDQVIWKEKISSPGSFAVNAVVNMPKPGNYKLGLAWDGPVEARYSLAWKPGKIDIPVISPLALISGLGMIAVAMGFVVYTAAKKLGWGYLGLGALLWVVTVAMKIVWAILVNPPLHSLTGKLPDVIGKPLFDLYVGALTGIFEVGITWIVLRYTRLGKATWNGAGLRNRFWGNRSFFAGSCFAGHDDSRDACAGHVPKGPAG